MAITLYSTGCPKCNVLKQKLNEMNIPYDIDMDTDKMIEMGFLSAPVLDVNGEIMDFSQAIRWLKDTADDSFCSSCSI